MDFANFLGNFIQGYMGSAVQKKTAQEQMQQDLAKTKAEYLLKASLDPRYQLDLEKLKHEKELVTPGSLLPTAQADFDYANRNRFPVIPGPLSPTEPRYNLEDVGGRPPMAGGITGSRRREQWQGYDEQSAIRDKQLKDKAAAIESFRKWQETPLPRWQAKLSSEQFEKSMDRFRKQELDTAQVKRWNELTDLGEQKLDVDWYKALGTKQYRDAMVQIARTRTDIMDARTQQQFEMGTRRLDLLESQIANARDNNERRALQEDYKLELRRADMLLTPYKEQIRAYGRSLRPEAGQKMEEAGQKLQEGVQNLPTPPPKTERGAPQGNAITPSSIAQLHGTTFSAVGDKFNAPRTGRLHGGFDLRLGAGTPVKAAADGQIIGSWAVDPKDGGGYGVRIKYATGQIIDYNHLASRLPGSGTVKAGQEVGKVFRDHLDFKFRNLQTLATYDPTGGKAPIGPAPPPKSNTPPPLNVDDAKTAFQSLQRKPFTAERKKELWTQKYPNGPSYDEMAGAKSKPEPKLRPQAKPGPSGTVMGPAPRGTQKEDWYTKNIVRKGKM